MDALMSAPPLENAMFTVPLSKLVGPEYLPLANDLVRMICIQVTIQLMIFLGSDGGAFFTAEFMLLLIYIVMGVLLYWLVVR
jgi:hypothetical protein